MSYPLKPDAFARLTNPADLKLQQRANLKYALGHGEVKFVAAKGYKVGATLVNVFVVTDAPIPFENHLKAAKATVSQGTAEITQPSGGPITVVVKTARGGLDAKAIAALVRTAIDPSIVGQTPQGDEAESDRAPAPPSAPPAPPKATTSARPSPAPAPAPPAPGRADDPQLGAYAKRRAALDQRLGEVLAGGGADAAKVRAVTQLTENKAKAATAPPRCSRCRCWRRSSASPPRQTGRRRTPPCRTPLRRTPPRRLRPTPHRRPRGRTSLTCERPLPTP
jgi:hypothetical protein